MYSIKTETCNSAWCEAAKLLKQEAFEQQSRNWRNESSTTNTAELLHVGMTIADPRQRLVCYRPINPAFAVAEVIWILAGSNDLDFIKFWNPRMKSWSDNGVALHGAYGYRLGSNPISDTLPKHNVKQAIEYDQLYNAYCALDSNSSSRQIVLQIWDNRYDLPLNNGAPTSKDVPCNVMSHLLVRDGKLNWMQVMRSNDLMWGTPYNFIQWTSIQEIMAGWLGLEVGQYTHIASSLHVYDELKAEFDAIDLSENKTVVNTDDLRMYYTAWLPVFGVVAETALAFTKAASVRDISVIINAYLESEEYLTTDANIKNLSAYSHWVYLLAGEACRRLGNIDAGKVYLHHMGEYFATSWTNWINYVQK